MQPDQKMDLCFQVLGKTIPVDHGFAIHGAISDVFKGYWLVRDPEGDLPLPVWVDHVGSKGTVWRQFRLEEGLLETPPENDERWITIEI